MEEKSEHRHLVHIIDVRIGEEYENIRTGEKKVHLKPHDIDFVNYHPNDYVGLVEDLDGRQKYFGQERKIE